MSPRTSLLIPGTIALAAVLFTPCANADEGMWTFDNFPATLVQERHGVEITPAWLDRVRAATIRLSGCTASFVSGEGMILTNHHCIANCLAQLSSSEENWLRDGFIAGAREGEIRCPTQHADVLMQIEDITARVGAATAGMDDVAANEARKRTLTRLEQICEQAAGTRDPRRCESVRLYGGGQYFLHHYKRYDDVRLVFAPEQAIAAFGGDPDNFQFPRWSLDMALLRAYEGGRPAATPNHLAINWEGPAAGEPVFVSGHPGSTDRLLSVAQVQAQRAKLPFWLLRAAELRGRYIQFGRIGPEQARVVSDALAALENGIKVRRNQLDALLDPALLAGKQAAEDELRARTQWPAGKDPWQDLERAAARDLDLHIPYTFIESGAGFNSVLFRHARTLVRGAAERAKPNDQRLREYVDNALPALVQQLRASVPIYDGRELLTFSAGLERMREYLGQDHPLVGNLLAEFSPDALAWALISQTRLADPDERLRLWEGGQAAIDASDDPMIRIAKLVDTDARAIRRQYEDEVEAVADAAAERIAAARFAAYGTGTYPDASFTLRLNFGTVQGWNEAGTPVAPFTTLARAWERATDSDPFQLPETWLGQRTVLDPDTPFNLSTSNDIIGGNSGSPLLNAQGEIVGLVFDGNRHAIAGTYWYDADRNRAVSVHPAIIKVALTQVYAAPAIARELGL